MTLELAIQDLEIPSQFKSVDSWLVSLRTIFDSYPWVFWNEDVDLDAVDVLGPGGLTTHRLARSRDEDGDLFITVEFNLPNAWFAEIEDDTYGALQGFRIYKENHGDLS